jgi:hypothetical protein
MLLQLLRDAGRYNAPPHCTSALLCAVTKRLDVRSLQPCNDDEGRSLPQALCTGKEGVGSPKPRGRAWSGPPPTTCPSGRSSKSGLPPPLLFPNLQKMENCLPDLSTDQTFTPPQKKTRGMSSAVVGEQCPKSLNRLFWGYQNNTGTRFPLNPKSKYYGYQTTWVI